MIIIKGTSRPLGPMADNKWAMNVCLWHTVVMVIVLGLSLMLIINLITVRYYTLHLPNDKERVCDQSKAAIQCLERVHILH